jgi:hypothetical protein
VKLKTFLHALLHYGELSLPRTISWYSEEDIRESETVLSSFHQRDKLDMPYTAPDVDADAAIWAAQYLYHALQFILLRDAGPDLHTLRIYVREL